MNLWAIRCSFGNGRVNAQASFPSSKTFIVCVHLCILFWTFCFLGYLVTWRKIIRMRLSIYTKRKQWAHLELRSVRGHHHRALVRCGSGEASFGFTGEMGLPTLCKMVVRDKKVQGCWARWSRLWQPSLAKAIQLSAIVISIFLTAAIRRTQIILVNVQWAAFFFLN